MDKTLSFAIINMYFDFRKIKNGGSQNQKNNQTIPQNQTRKSKGGKDTPQNQMAEFKSRHYSV